MSKHYQQEEINMKNFFANQEKSDQFDSMDFRVSTKNPWRASTVERKNLPDVKGINDMFLD